MPKKYRISRFSREIRRVLNIRPIEQMGRPMPVEREILKRIHENEEKLRQPLMSRRELFDTIKDTHKNFPISIITDGEMTIGLRGAVTLRKYILVKTRRYQKD